MKSYKKDVKTDKLFELSYQNERFWEKCFKLDFKEVKIGMEFLSIYCFDFMLRHLKKFSVSNAISKGRQ